MSRYDHEPWHLQHQRRRAEEQARTRREEDEEFNFQYFFTLSFVAMFVTLMLAARLTRDDATNPSCNAPVASAASEEISTSDRSICNQP